MAKHRYQQPELGLGIFLMLYLWTMGLVASGLLVINFPTEAADGVLRLPVIVKTGDENQPWIWPIWRVSTVEQGLLSLAMLAGIAGSLIHAAQSLASYVGNGSFVAALDWRGPRLGDRAGRAGGTALGR